MKMKLDFTTIEEQLVECYMNIAGLLSRIRTGETFKLHVQILGEHTNLYDYLRPDVRNLPQKLLGFYDEVVEQAKKYLSNFKPANQSSVQ